MRVVPHPPPVQVFAVEDTAVQVTWRDAGAGTVCVTAADTKVEVDTAGGPGAAVLGDLPAGRWVDVRVEGPGLPPSWSQAVRTLEPPPGAELCRFATVNDLHLGEDRFGFLRTMRERPGRQPATAVRAASGAVAEALEWGAEALVLKGDLTSRSHATDWPLVSSLLQGIDVPVVAAAGNHDVMSGRARIRRHVGPHASLADPVAVLDLPGVRVIAMDTTVERSHAGRLGRCVDDLFDAVASSDRPRVVAHHHHFHRSIPLSYPVGLWGPRSRDVLDRLARTAPDTLLVAGHTHRHRRRQVGPLTLAEVGSTKDYPGTWAGYVVHEGGVRQVVRRVAAPDVIPWTDHTGGAVGGLWGRVSPGRLTDRCFRVTWPPR